ncbi:hypothetical protein ACET3Z_007762 [Daucus carota]
MGDKELACGECKHKDSLIHGKKAAPVTTFNKILFGGYDISKDLCLPQKISQAIPNLVPGDKYILQDTNGQQWEVTLGIKDKIHWAFREGWNKFYEDHGLKTGYILAFHYTMDAPFVVEIFDRTGFEKINFPVATGKKRKTSENDGNCNAIVGECQNLSNHSSKNQGVAFSGTSDSEARTQSQPMSKDKSLSLENGNGEYQLAASANCDIEPHCMIDRYDGSKYEQDRTTVLNLANSEMQFGVELDGSTDKGTYPSNAATESDAIAERNSTKISKRTNQISGGEERENEVRKVTKTELVNSSDGDSLDASAFSFTAIVRSPEVLEVAAAVILWADEKKVVNLQGPNQKVWPVLYHNKLGIKALTSGWENFCMSNGLRIGDECAFKLVDEEKTIFRIDVKTK